MAFKVLITAAALDDLREIIEHIAQDDPRAAERLGHRLIDRALALANLPQRFAFHDEAHQVRKAPVGAYLIFYMVDDREQLVSILHFWHGARLGPNEL